MPGSGGVGNVVPNKILTEMAMGFSRSRALCAAARLGVADALGSEERTVEDLAASCGAQPHALYRLLRALASFGIVTERTPQHFALTQLGSALRKDTPDSEWAAVVFWGDLLADNWSYLTECIRTGENAARIMERERIATRWSKDPNANCIFRAVMGTAPAEDYMSIVRAWDFSAHRVVADLGGGGGALMEAVLQAYPRIRGMLVDRQESIDTARPRFESNKLGERCQLVPADLCVSIPPGADVYMMKHVLHGYDDQRAIDLLRNCGSVLTSEGRVLIIEFVLPDVVDHAEPELEFRFMSDLNMLAVTGGKERSAVEWKQLLDDAGLKFLGIIPVTGNFVSIIEAARVA